MEKRLNSDERFFRFRACTADLFGEPGTVVVVELAADAIGADELAAALVSKS